MVTTETALVVRDTAASAMAAHAKATIEARWIVAQRKPRSLDQVRTELLRECARPAFAAGARWRKPVGGKWIEGLSIRFVEQAMVALGNIHSQSVAIYDDAATRIIEVSVTDYERGTSHSVQVTVSKTIERRALKDGQVAISSRRNSTGQIVHLVEATDDELLVKEGSLTSKAIRTCGLRLIPAWLQDECEAAIQKTSADKAAADPDAESRKICVAFAKVGVTPAQIEEHLGHPMAQIVPAEIVQLREMLVALRAGEFTWAGAVAATRGEDAPASAKGVDAVKAKLRKPKAAAVTTEITCCHDCGTPIESGELCSACEAAQ